MEIVLKIICPSCKGTGVYRGMAEGAGTAVVCYKCNGSGCYDYKYTYEEFTERKLRDDVKRVYLNNTGYMINLGKIDYDNIGILDMDKEGISYEEFLDGKMPKNIEKLACPLRSEQSACHDIDGFIKECERLNGKYITKITDCRMYGNHNDCWNRFYKGERKND